VAVPLLSGAVEVDEVLTAQPVAVALSQVADAKLAPEVISGEVFVAGAVAAEVPATSCA
jgi:hypothetical protein